MDLKDPCVVFDFNHHKQEVCGLKWSFDDKYLASGGNDNKLCVWSTHHGHSGAVSAGSIHRRQSRFDAAIDGASTGNQSNNEAVLGAPMYEFCDHLAAVKV